MTLPEQRTRAVLAAYQAILALARYTHGDLDAKVRVPRALLSQALQTLRHYPTQFDLKVSAEKLPEIWGPIDKEEV